MDFYSISEVVDMSDKSQKTIRRQIAAGRLRAEKIGKADTRKGYELLLS